MGRRDYRHREPKKTKKEAKTAPPATVMPSPTFVEVVRKRKKREEESEKEAEEGK